MTIVKKLLPLLLGLTTLVVPIASHAADSLNGAYFTPQFGKSWFQGTSNLAVLNHNKTSYGTLFGMRWNGWGFDIGFTSSGSYAIKSSPVTLKITSWTLGPDYKFMLTSHWWANARIGVNHFRATTKLGSYSNSVNGNRWYAGIGGGYDFNQSVGLGLSYTYFKAQKNQINLNFANLMMNLELRFN